MEKAIKDFEKELKAENYTDYKMYVSRAYEFMFWLNDNNIQDWAKVRTKHVIDFIEYQKTKPKADGKFYKAGTLNKYRDVLKCFSAFMQANKIGYFQMLVSKFHDSDKEVYKPSILSLDQIKLLFATIDTMDVWLLSDRDRVMLHLLYSCGMRIKEVQNINI
jgi:site-specific recombinase XerD